MSINCVLYRIAVFVREELYFALPQVREIKIHIILMVIKICTSVFLFYKLALLQVQDSTRNDKHGTL